MRSGPKHSERRPGSRAASAGQRPTTSVRPGRRAGRENVDTLPAASGSHERLRIASVAQSTGERTERVVDPEAVFASAGHWYAAVWDVEVDDERLLRIDRIASVEPAGERFAPRGLRGAGRPLYTPSDRDVDVRVRLR